MIGDMLAGAANASLVTLVGYPFDTTKVKMQSGLFKTTYSCISYTLEHKGIYGFYKGSSMALLSHLIKRPIQYPIIEALKKYSKQNNYNNKYYNYLIGGIQGPIGTLFGNPLQVVKIRSQTSKLSTTTHAVNIFKESGVRGFYRGFTATLFKDTLFGASYIGTYYTLRDIYGTDNWYQNFCNGAASHMLTWMCLIPIDYVKTNMQKSNVPITMKKVIINGYNKHGISGFWRGVVPACLRTVPVSGIAMVGYESIRKYVNEVE